MKYFTLELLHQTGEKYDKLWMENLRTYWSQFKDYENRLPARFVKEYCKHGFHDYYVKSISLYKDETKIKKYYNVELKVSLNGNTFLIRYINVTKYNLDVDKIGNKKYSIYEYGEILPIDSIRMSHEIILSDENIIYIEFNRIIFKRITE
jgi:hypothetical protein